MMKCSVPAVIVASLGLLAPIAAHAETESEHDFAERILPRMKSAIATGNLRIKPDEPLVIQWNNGKSWGDATFYLYRIYSYCQNAAPQDCEAVTAEYVRKVSAPEPEHTAQSLRIIVRDEEYVAAIRAMKWPDVMSPLIRPIGADLYAIMAFDAPETTSIANRKMIEELGLSEEAAWKLASQQTKDSLPRLDIEKLGSCQSMAFADIDYLASLLIETDEWTEIAKRAGPTLFVTAVSDGLVLTGLLPSGPDLDSFKKAVEEDCAAAPRCISPHIYRFKNGQWAIAD